MRKAKKELNPPPAINNFEDYAASMQKVYAEAIATAETIKQSADADREEAFRQLDAARDAREAAEENGERMALEYFAKQRKFIEENTREEVIRRLVLAHLHNNKPVSEIMFWFEIEEEKMDHYLEIYKREKVLRDKPKIEYIQNGRGGKVVYRNVEIRLEFDWEFAGGNSVAIIFVPEPKHWEVRTELPLKERNNILEFVGAQVVRDQAPQCIYEITDTAIYIVYPK